MGHRKRGAGVGTADAIRACQIERFNASGRLTGGALTAYVHSPIRVNLFLARGAYSLLEHFNGFPQSLQSCFFFLGFGNPPAVLLAVGVT